MPRVPRPAPEFRGAAKPLLAPLVHFVRFDDARALLTVRPQDPVWSGAPPICPSGAIVRIRPPAEASNADVLRQRDAHERAGAARVRVEPRAAGAKVTTPEREGRAKETVSAKARMRFVVMSMAGESRVHDRSALVDELDRALSEQGV